MSMQKLAMHTKAPTRNFSFIMTDSIKKIQKYQTALYAGLLLLLIASTETSLAQVPALTPEQAEELLRANQPPSQEVQSQLLDNAGIIPRPESAGAQVEGIEENAQSTQGPETLEEDIAETVIEEPLRQFGYELFSGIPSTFAPATNIPVPLNYVIGPNDTIIIQLYGQRNVRYELVVTREGVIQFPEVGPLNVAGLAFEEAQELIETTVATSLIGQQVSTTMGALRSIQIFVLGEAFRPGSYTVSSLSTMTNALFSSGGVTRVGSLRDIRLMRQGQLVTSLDLYDLLLRGDTSGDVRLQPNDVIFIPPIGVTVGIAGEVRRPAIFELKNESTLEDVIPLGGGFLPTAFPSVSRIERINELGERTLVNIDLSTDDEQDFEVRDGDVVQIFSILDQVEDVVMLEGHVNRPGGFEWREGLRVTDILPDVTAMLPNPDLQYSLISREVQPERTLQILNVNLREAFQNPGSQADLVLQPRDRLLVFGARQSRRQQVEELVQTLRNQATFDELPLVVSIDGNTLFPGEYPLLQGMTLDDLIMFSGGLGLNTDIDYVLLERQVDLEGTIEVFATQLDGQSLTTVEPIVLQPEDRVIVFNANLPRDSFLQESLAKLRNQADTNNPTKIVSVIGNVRFPGSYPLQNSLTVNELIDIAGGLTESAETRFAEVTRYDAEPEVGRQVGHIGIDLRASSAYGRNFNLQPFDQLVVRQMPNWTEVETVTVSGEVNSPGTYVITQDESLTDLIQRAGGLSEFADPEAALFLRESLREAEARSLAEYRLQLEQDIITLRLQQQVVGAGAGRQQGVSSDAIALLDRIETLEPVGRLVIDLPSMLQGTADSLILRDGDRLVVPRFQQEITVTGEIFRPTSHLFEEGLDYSEYIARSGGLTDDADRGNIYVLRKNGEMDQLSKGYWFFEGRPSVEPGDTIVVPFEAYKPYAFFVWSEISRIAANLSTTLLLIDRITE